MYISLKVLEAQRREAGHLSRTHEKKEHTLNLSLYHRLKKIRAECNTLYVRQQELQDSKSQNQLQLYMLNKNIHNHPVVATKATSIPSSFKEKTKIQGIDSGVVVMTSDVFSSQKPPFESVNRFPALQDHEDNIWHTMDDNVFFLKMTAKIFNAAINTKMSPSNSTKKKQKKRIKSKCQLRRFYAKQCSQHRRHMQPKSFITFTGNWRGVITYIKGHTRRSTKPYYSRLAVLIQDTVIKTNGFSKMESNDGKILPPLLISL